MNPNEALVQISNVDLATWSDEKKNAFVATFQQRIKVARAILEVTACHILEKARERSFLSEWHTRKDKRLQDVARSDRKRYYDLRHGAYAPSTIGGRGFQEIHDIGVARGDAIIQELPGLSAAVQIIDPETAEKIKKVKALSAQGNKLLEQIEALSEPIRMSQLDQNMTVGAFREMVKVQDKKRAGLRDKATDVANEAQALQKDVDFKLFKGLPGLSDAVIDTVISLVDQSTALGTLDRRVEEQVKFGDSAEAMRLLEHFEEDEKEVSKSVAARFAEAMQTLRAKGKSMGLKVRKAPARRALKKGGK